MPRGEVAWEKLNLAVNSKETCPTALLGIVLDLLRSDDIELRQRYRKRVMNPVRDHVITLIAAAVDEGEISVETDAVDLADAVIGGLVYRNVVLGQRPLSMS